MRTGRAAVAQGLLIVNADDWGLSTSVTDAILACFEARAITSVSGMVWMQDSERAAAIAREHRVPSGLHLNLDETFTAGRVPRCARLAQERIAPWFSSPGRHQIVSYNPSGTFRRSLDTSIEAQLDEFRNRYGREPTHVDGHHHVQLAWNVLASNAIPDGTAIRTTRRFEAASTPVRVLRALRERWIRHRFRTTESFYDLRWLGLANGRSERASLDVPGTFGTRTVEVMTHPAARDEFGLLCSNKWSRVIDSTLTGSFDDLH